MIMMKMKTNKNSKDSVPLIEKRKRKKAKIEFENHLKF